MLYRAVFVTGGCVRLRVTSLIYAAYPGMFGSGGVEPCRLTGYRLTTIPCIDGHAFMARATFRNMLILSTPVGNINIINQINHSSGSKS